MDFLQRRRRASLSPESAPRKDYNAGALAALTGSVPQRADPSYPQDASSALSSTQQKRPPLRPTSFRDSVTSSLPNDTILKLNLRASRSSSPASDGFWDFHMAQNQSRVQAQGHPSSMAGGSNQMRNPRFISVPVVNHRTSIESQRALFETRFSRQSSRASYSTGHGSGASDTISSRSSYSSAVYGDDYSLSRPGPSRTISASSSYSSAVPEDEFNLSRPGPSRAISLDASTYGQTSTFVKYHTSRPQLLLRPQRLSGNSVPGPVPRLKNKPGEAFAKLPKEVLDVLFDKLRDVHAANVKDGAGICSTCYARDLCSMATVNRQCFKSAQWKLYERIWLVGADSPSHAKKFKLKAGARLKLLRRTLRENPYLANHVKELKVPDVDNASSPQDNEIYLDLVATIIMACPKLERFVGLNISYDHQYSKLFHALSSRQMLTEHVWDIVGSRLPTSSNRKGDRVDKLSSRQYGMTHSTLSYEQARSFINSHGNWEHLSSLVVHCAADGAMNSSTLSSSIAQLPALQHLCLSSIANLPPKFLADLPTLKSLHLSNLSGLSTQALALFANTNQAAALSTLSLTNLPLISLPVLARLFSNLTSLQKLTFIQETSPSLPVGTSIFLHPYLASPSLETITWDIRIPSSELSTDATNILAQSIKAGGFPNLRRIKAPCDYDGSLQAVCKAIHSITTPLDKAMAYAKPENKRKDSGIDGIQSSSSSFSSSTDFCRSLRAARLAAQGRLEVARMRPKFKVVIEDFTLASQPIFVAAFELGGFLGQIGTDKLIEYDLSEDIEGKDQAGVLVEDILAYREKVSEQGCDGSWNMRIAKGMKKDKKKVWEHKERSRWHPLEIARLY